MSKSTCCGADVLYEHGVEFCDDCGKMIVKEQEMRIDKDNEQHTDGINEIAMDIGALVQDKNAAYGSAFAKAGDFLRILYPDGIKPEQYNDMLLLVRIFDKQMRIANRKDAFGESPYRDIAGYGILGDWHREAKVDE